MNRLQRGSTNWPFVIVLLALLVFIYMWWAAQDERDSHIRQIDEKDTTIDELRTVANATRKELDTVAKLVGWPKQMEAVSALGVDRAVTVDVVRLRAHLDPVGVVAQGDGQMNGFVKEMLENGFLQYESEKRTGSPSATATDYKYKTMSDELKTLLNELSSEDAPAAPHWDGDENDAAAKQKYEDEKDAFDDAYAAWVAKIAKAVASEGFNEYDETITLYGISDPDEQQLVRVLFVSQPTTQTVEDVFQAFRDAPAKMRDEINSIMTADVASIKQLEEQITAKDTELTEKQTEIQTAADTYATDMAAEQLKLQAAQEDLQTARLAAQTAANALAQEQEDRRKDVTKLTADKAALQEGLRLIKQKQELVIRRDDADGSIVASNPMLNTATIDLGYSDKVYIGQRFTVSAVDKVGDRVNKGTIMITKVTGDHSARARIQEAWDTITQGDFIHNPLYSRTDVMNVYFAGPMSKWPKDMAKSRLAAMGVNLQNAINGDTDYIVVPNSWVVPVSTGDGDGDEDEEEDVGAKSPLEKIEGRARLVGATVISERLFDSFLAY